MRNFYVYLHRKSDTNEIYYVGKGTAKRAWYFRDRSEWWNRIHNKHGTSVEICQENMHEDDAYTLEMWLIAKLKHSGIDLCNMTDGGESPPIHFGINHPLYNSEIFSLVHIKTGEKFIGTQQDFLRKYNTYQGNLSSFLNGKFKTHKGWVKEGTDISSVGRFGKNHPSYDPTIIEFENKDGRTFKGNRYEFREKFDLPVLQVNAFLKGKTKTIRGWFKKEMKNNLNDNIGKKNNKHDPSVFIFEHKDGRIFKGTGWDLINQHGATPTGVHAIKTRKIERHAGWKILEWVRNA